MFELVLTSAERALLEALNALGVPYLIPALGGEGLDRVDVVLTASGLEAFEKEFAGAHEYDLDGVRVKVLPLERVIARKRAARRAKDSAQIPMLEAALAARKARNNEEDNR